MSPISSDTIMIRFSFRTTRPSDTVPIIGLVLHDDARATAPYADNAHARLLCAADARLMALPLVAIVGRPNVGKSALFNRILGERRAIVDPMAGLTRDRLYAESEWRGRRFTIVDTAGLVLGKDRDEVPAQRELPPRTELVDDQLAGRIAILGRPNVGKSSLLNAVIGDERSLVAAEPGTTRDPVDTRIMFAGKQLLLVDTAGIRRPGLTRGVEQYSLLRGLRAMERADVGIVVIDAREGINQQDVHIAGYVVEAGRGLVLALNKWDLLAPEEKEEKVWGRRIREQLNFAPWAPVSYISAKTGQRVTQPLEVALKVIDERHRRVATPELNRWLRSVLWQRDTPSRKGRRLRVMYATQAESATPTFVFFVNEPELVHFSYRRFLETQLRQAFGFEGTAMRLVFRRRGEEP